MIWQKTTSPEGRNIGRNRCKQLGSTPLELHITSRKRLICNPWRGWCSWVCLFLPIWMSYGHFSWKMECNHNEGVPVGGFDFSTDMNVLLTFLKRLVPYPNQSRTKLNYVWYIYLDWWVSDSSFFQVGAKIRIFVCIFMQKRPFFARKSHFFSADNHGIPAVQ